MARSRNRELVPGLTPQAPHRLDQLHQPSMLQGHLVLQHLPSPPPSLPSRRQRVGEEEGGPRVTMSRLAHETPASRGVAHRSTGAPCAPPSPAAPVRQQASPAVYPGEECSVPVGRRTCLAPFPPGAPGQRCGDGPWRGQLRRSAARVATTSA